MKTSNKLLLGFFILILIGITVVFGNIKSYVNDLFIPENGEIITEKRMVQEFNRLKAEGDIHIILTAGAQPALELKGDKNLLKNTETSVKDGELLIKFPDKTQLTQAIEVKISADSIKSIDLSKNSSLECSGVINSKKLDLHLSTDAQLKMEITCAETFLNCSTGALIELKGSTDFFHINSSTGAEVNALNLVAHNGIIEGNTGSVMNINVTGEIEVTLSTGSVVKCQGNPVNKKVDLTTGGIFNKLD